MIYRAFGQPIQFHKSRARIRGAFAGKRGGKTESGAVEACIFAEQQVGYKPNGIDPYLGAIVAPTTDMVRNLSLKKFLAYGSPFITRHHQTHGELDWRNGSQIYVRSADKPQRLEGLKLNWAWLDEVFQMEEQVFLEVVARVADTQGFIWCTGSLGVQYENPKNHWAYKYFKDKTLPDTEVFEWATADNPYFPRSELERLKDIVDPRTYRQMFTLDWDIPPLNIVYDDWDMANEEHHVYDPKLETSVCIDWGWTHPMAVGFFQYDPERDRVYLFDEIVSSKLTLDKLWELISAKKYKIKNWYCDIAGNQEREQTGYSNIRWFKDKHGVSFKYASSARTYGITIVRGYIKNAKAQRRFFISPQKCPKSLDCLKRYNYVVKKGVTTEDPTKKDDDPADMIRYYFVNRHDPRNSGAAFQTLDRWGDWK